MVFGSKSKGAKKEEIAKKMATADNKETAAKAEVDGTIGEQAIESAPAPAVPNAAQQPAGQQATPPLTAKTLAVPPAEEIYVDGISSLSFRANVVKLDCYRVVGQDPQESTETRMAAYRLVMPATALQELIQLLQNASERQRVRSATEAGTDEAG